MSYYYSLNIFQEVDLNVQLMAPLTRHYSSQTAKATMFLAHTIQDYFIISKKLTLWLNLDRITINKYHIAFLKPREQLL